MHIKRLGLEYFISPENFNREGVIVRVMTFEEHLEEEKECELRNKMIFYLRAIKIKCVSTMSFGLG